jgi:hypothetical protein
MSEIRNAYYADDWSSTMLPITSTASNRAALDMAATV